MIKLHNNHGEILVNPSTISHLYASDTGTKIFFSNGAHIIVNENPERIHSLVQIYKHAGGAPAHV